MSDSRLKKPYVEAVKEIESLKASLAEVKKELSRCQGAWGREQARADKQQGECLHKYPEGLCPVCWRTVTKELAEAKKIHHDNQTYCPCANGFYNRAEKAEKELAELKIVKRRYQEKAGEYLDRCDRLEKELAEAKEEITAVTADRVVAVSELITAHDREKERAMKAEKELAEMALVNEAQRIAIQIAHEVAEQSGQAVRHALKDVLALKSGSELLAKRDRETEARVWEKCAEAYGGEKTSDGDDIERFCLIKAKASRQTVKGGE